MHKYKKGDRVEVDARLISAWGYSSGKGTIAGTKDPLKRGNVGVVTVKLDSGPSIFEVKGVHAAHLTELEE